GRHLGAQRLPVAVAGGGRRDIPARRGDAHVPPNRHGARCRFDGRPGCPRGSGLRRLYLPGIPAHPYVDAHEGQAAPAAGREVHTCGCARSPPCTARLTALMYALAEAATMSVSAPRPLTTRPSRSTRTVTSPWASVPPVMLFTE